MSKKQFSYTAKTGISKSKWFSKKRLAEYAVNIGNVCEFGCSYCYVPDLPFKHSSVKKLIEEGHNADQICN